MVQSENGDILVFMSFIALHGWTITDLSSPLAASSARHRITLAKVRFIRSSLQLHGLICASLGCSQAMLFTSRSSSACLVTSQHQRVAEDVDLTAQLERLALLMQLRHEFLGRQDSACSAILCCPLLAPSDYLGNRSVTLNRSPHCGPPLGPSM